MYFQTTKPVKKASHNTHFVSYNSTDQKEKKTIVSAFAKKKHICICYKRKTRGNKLYSYSQISLPSKIKRKKKLIVLRCLPHLLVLVAAVPEQNQ